MTQGFVQNNFMDMQQYTMNHTSGVPVKGGMPLSQHQAQQQTFYVAAISNGIPPQIANLLPPRALQCSWVLHQAAQNKMVLAPAQQQQFQSALNEYIEQARQQLAHQMPGINKMVNPQFQKNEDFTLQQRTPLDNQIPSTHPNSNSNDLIVQPSLTLSQPSGQQEDMMSSLYFGSNELDNPFSANPTYQPNSSSSPPSNPPSNPPPSQNQPMFEGYSSALKEGYKDETFGTPDLSLMKPSQVKQPPPPPPPPPPPQPQQQQESDSFNETHDLQSSWYDSTTAIDLGLDGFDWDNNDFVKLDDNDGTPAAVTANNTTTGR
ncbi:hypothetical protein EDC96DRAFT_496321 [Choanephora cucurbitarum]|nr:hypothetical protein EDC96DRAFT_496321 [Choanephora cucurbitarum]